MGEKDRPKQPRRPKKSDPLELLLPLLTLLSTSTNARDSSEELSGILRTWLGCSSVQFKEFQKESIGEGTTPLCLRGIVGDTTGRRSGPSGGKTAKTCKGRSFVECIGHRLLNGEPLEIPGVGRTQYGSLRIADLANLLKKTQPRGKSGRPLACCTGNGSSSVMLIPLRSLNSVFGLIEAADKESGHFTEPSVEMAEGIARLIARTWDENRTNEKYRAIFEGAAIGLMVEDFSAVKEYIERLHQPDRDGLAEYFNRNPASVARCAHKVLVRDVNKAAMDVYGATTRQDLISDHRSVFTEESFDALKRLFIALSKGQTRFHANALGRSLKGEPKQLSLTWYAPSAYEQDWSQIVCSVEDVTERKRAVDRLNEQLLFFQTLIDTVPTPIFYKDTEQRYLGCNKAFEVYGRTTKQDVVGKTVFDLLGDNRKARIHHLADGELLRYPGKKLYESSIEHPDGRRSTNIHRKATFVRPDGTSAGIVGVIMDITEQKIAEDRLRKSQEELRNLSRRLQYVREEERKAISREIHDQLGQTLTVLQMELALLTRKVPSSEKSLIEKTKQLKKRVREAIEIVRSISARTRPEMLDDLGLASAIEWQVSEFQNLTGLTCTTNIDQADREIEADLSTALFRILQEALTNVWRHAHATEVRVLLEFQGDALVLAVHDNGKGITERQANDSTSTGLIGMRERVYPWAGQVSIEGLMNSGTTVKVTIPLKTVNG